MAKIFRKLERKRNWDNAEWLQDGDVKSIVSVQCLATNNNSLSIYVVDGHPEQIDRLVAALALTRDYLNVIDLATAPEEILDACMIGTRSQIQGTTPDQVVNNWHVDLIELSVTNVANLAKSIKSQGEICRVQRNDVLQAIRNSLTQQWIDVTRINDKLRRSLASRGMGNLL